MKGSIIEEAVSLPLEKRVELVAILIQCLNPAADEHVDRLWIREAARRYKDIKKGTVKAIPAGEVLEAMHRRLTK